MAKKSCLLLLILAVLANAQNFQGIKRLLLAAVPAVAAVTCAGDYSKYWSNDITNCAFPGQSFQANVLNCCKQVLLEVDNNVFHDRHRECGCKAWLDIIIALGDDPDDETEYVANCVANGCKYWWDAGICDEQRIKFPCDHGTQDCNNDVWIGQNYCPCITNLNKMATSKMEDIRYLQQSQGRVSWIKEDRFTRTVLDESPPLATHVNLEKLYFQEGESQQCEWCSFGIDPCAWNFDSQGERLANIYKCDPKTNRLSQTEVCDVVDICATLLTDPARTAYDVTNEMHQICPQVDSDPKFYKKKMSLSIEPTWQDCSNFLNDYLDGTLNKKIFKKVKEFTLKNLWYLSKDIALKLCDVTDYALGRDCQITWLGDMKFDQVFVNYWDSKALHKCISFNENLKQYDMDPDSKEDDPCLGYHETKTMANCAYCKPGMARILTTIISASGKKENLVICGSVRSPSRNTNGVYSYLDPDKFSSDDISAQTYECIPSPYYEAADAYRYSKVIEQKYYPRPYFNITDEQSEILCLANSPWINKKKCKHETVSPDSSIITSLTTTEQQIQKAVIVQTVGCNACNDDQVPLIKYYIPFGLYYQTCNLQTNYNQTSDDVPCQNLGYVKVWEGYIASEQSLVCKKCSTLIPNCQVCSSFKKCDMCEPGYLETAIIDDDGSERLVCLKGYCGTKGFDKTCKKMPAKEDITGCRRLLKLQYDETTILLNCVQCDPGYAKYGYAVKNIENMGMQVLQRCEKREGSLTKNLFIQPEQVDFFTHEHDQKMYDQLMSNDLPGERLDNALYFIQQAFTMFTDSEKFTIDAYETGTARETAGLADDIDQRLMNDYHKYENVTVNIWLYKGTHHFVQCQDFQSYKHGTVADPDDPWNGFKDNPEVTKFTSLCKSKITYFPIRYSDNDGWSEENDNRKIYVRPLECKLKNTIFQNLESWGPQSFFDQYCVDLEKGDAKPQLRIHGSAMFNITNFAQFENIEFTAVDNLVKITEKNEANRQLYYDLIKHTPFRLCDFEQEATSYLETPKLKKMQGDDIKYECRIKGFNATENRATNVTDTKCDDLLPTTYLGPRSCRGEPAHANFFKKSPYSFTNSKVQDLATKYTYTERHKVLFNLYAFDSMRSNRTHSPTLNLINCDFVYFLDDMQALIQVETNNYVEMAVESKQLLNPTQETSVIKDQFIILVGEDRGARIDIQNSTFRHSHFCKGLISYRKTQKIDFATEPKYFRLSKQVQRDAAYEVSDGRNSSFIRIKDSTFENLAYQQLLTVLTNKFEEKLTCGSGTETFFKCVFEPYDGRGFILNLQDFPGTIQIQNSHIMRNMAYIKDYFMQENQLGKGFIQPSTIQFSDFEKQLGQLNFKVCNLNTFQGQYLTQSLTDPYGSFDDQEFANYYESISPLLIVSNQGPVLFKNNTFMENIGTLGGAMHIFSPDFVTNKGSNVTNSQPYIYLEDNLFQQNMAYFAGNALYITHTSEFTKPGLFKDYRNMCGAGVHVEGNKFELNVGLKRHNGGAAVHRCLLYDEAFDGKKNNATSSLVLAERNKTDTDVGNFTHWYDDPMTKYDSFSDLYNSNVTYKVLKYATDIKNNIFNSNTAGMKGSALVISFINAIEIQDNLFTSNQPAVSHNEKRYSPYYKYFSLPSNSTKPLTFNFVASGTCNATNEAEYIAKCYQKLSYIDLPALQGTIYLESCESNYRCFSPVYETYVSEMAAETNTAESEWIGLLAKFASNHQVSIPFRAAELKNNVFDNSQGMRVLVPAQDYQQATGLFLIGGNAIIHDNIFENTASQWSGIIRTYAPDIFYYMPTDYFQYSQAPIIYIKYTKQSFQRENYDQADLEKNIFRNNKHIQILALPASFRGSLIYVESDVPEARFGFRNNLVENNAFRGENARLVEVNGPIMSIQNNTLRNNGYLSEGIFANHTDSVKEVYKDLLVFPYEPYLHEDAQQNGIFGLIFDKHEIAKGNYHHFSGNEFQHNFCVFGCAYYVKGTMSQQILFFGNRYSNIISRQPGAIYSGSDFQLRKNSIPFFQMFKKETITNTVGGAFFVKNLNNGGLTIISDSIFYNNFGEQGGSISLDQGGILYAKDNYFSNDIAFLEKPTGMETILAAKEETESRLSNNSTFDASNTTQSSSSSSPTGKPSIAEIIKAAYFGTVPIDNLIQPSLMEKAAAVINIHGQLYIQNSRVDIDPYLVTRLEFLNKTLVEFLAGDGILDLAYENGRLLQKSSYLVDCIFENLSGSISSAVTVQESGATFLSFAKVGKITAFRNNVSNQGSTLYSVQAVILFRNITSAYNTAVRGGCIQIVNSEFDVVNSHFEHNTADLGGAIFAIQSSVMRVRSSKFYDNKAGTGSVVYSMANQISTSTNFQSRYIVLQKLPNGAQPSLVFEDSEILSNWATQATIHILRSSLRLINCDMVDNYAYAVTHGFTMVASDVYLEITRIKNTDEMKQKIMDLRLQSVDTGYFNLYSSSELHLSNKTEVSNLWAQKQSVLSAISESSFYASNDVRITNNNAANIYGYTMQFQNTKTVDIKQTSFSDNQQINIKIDYADLAITNSTFTNGKKQHVYASHSKVRMYGVSFFNSTDETATGHAVFCDACNHLQIYSCNFENLRANKATAIKILDQMQTSSEIVGSTFHGNSALQKAGAIELEQAGKILIKNSTFTSNEVSDPSWRFSDGGAIYFGCSPRFIGDGECEVVLDSNMFKDNRAQNKGGAMRYINKNFTTVYAEQSTGRRLLFDGADHKQTEFLDTNSYVANAAAQSDTIASYPSYFQYIFKQSGETYSSAEGQQVSFAPGQDLTLIIEIYDQEGYLTSDEQDATCTINFEGGQDLKEGSTILNADSVAKNGIITFGQLNIRQVPNSDSQLSLTFSSLETFGNDVAALKNPPSLSIHARPCEEGESYGALLTCLPCEPGYKLYQIQDEPGSCEPCQLQEECFGANTTAPRAEYWRTSPISTNYIKCFNPEACLAGNSTYPIGICHTGYQGVLCADCTGRHRRNDAFSCTECSDQNMNIFISVLYFLSLISAVFMLVRISMRGSSLRRPLSSVYIKIFLNHFQILQVISQIKFGWPDAIQQVLNYQQYVASLPTQIISFDCLMIDFITGPNPSFSFNYMRLTTFYTLPVVVILISFIFWLIKRCCFSKLMTKQEQLDKTVATIAITWFLFYPTIVSYLAQSINCTDIEGTWRLYDDLEEICFDGTHLNVVLGISIPGLFLWAFGMPILGLYLIRRARRNLTALEFHSDPAIYNDMRDRNKLRLGFLTQGYEEDYDYWEIVLLLRKTILVLMMTFLAPVSSGIQSLSAILLLLAFLAMQIKKKPFYDDRLNMLESVSLTVQIGIIYLGLFYQAGKNDPFVTSDSVKYSILILIIAVSIQFITLFILRMRLEMLKATVENNSCCFWLLSCGRVKNKIAFKKKNDVNQLGQDEIREQDIFDEEIAGENEALPGVNDDDDVSSQAKEVKMETENVVNPKDVHLQLDLNQLDKSKSKDIDNHKSEDSAVDIMDNSLQESNFLNLKLDKIGGMKKQETTMIKVHDKNSFRIFDGLNDGRTQSRRFEQDNKSSRPSQRSILRQQKSSRSHNKDRSKPHSVRFRQDKRDKNVLQPNTDESQDADVPPTVTDRRVFTSEADVPPTETDRGSEVNILDAQGVMERRGNIAEIDERDEERPHVVSSQSDPDSIQLSSEDREDQDDIPQLHFKSKENFTQYGSKNSHASSSKRKSRKIRFE